MPHKYKRNKQTNKHAGRCISSLLTRKCGSTNDLTYIVLRPSPSSVSVAAAAALESDGPDDNPCTRLVVYLRHPQQVTTVTAAITSSQQYKANVATQS